MRLETWFVFEKSCSGYLVLFHSCRSGTTTIKANRCTRALLLVCLKKQFADLMRMATYDCSKCPGFCCSYPVIPIDRRDVERLARHFDINFDTAKSRFTKQAHGRKFCLKRKTDEHFGRICKFFDTTARRCGVYEARPSTCRQYPAQKRCGYYDFLKFEREQQGDETWIARTDTGDWH